jgi:hypothetical protein
VLYCVDLIKRQGSMKVEVRKDLTDFYVVFQTIISRLDQNVYFYLDIGDGRKIVKVCHTPLIVKRKL